MNKETKKELVSDLKSNFSQAKAIFFADYKGLTVEKVNDYRKRLRTQKVKVKVIKNNLARLAVKEAKLGEQCDAMMDRVVGPTLITFAFDDPAATAKVVQKFADENEVFNLKESLLGNKVLSIKEVEDLSKLPSKEVLLSRLLAAMNSPVSSFVSVLAAVPRSLVQVLSAIESKKREQS